MVKDRLVIYSGDKDNVKLRYVAEKTEGYFKMGEVLGRFADWKLDTQARYPKNGVCYVSREVLTDSGKWIADNPDGGVVYREARDLPLLYMET